MAKSIREKQRQVEESAAGLLDGVQVENTEVAAYSGIVGCRHRLA